MRNTTLMWGVLCLGLSLIMATAGLAVDNVLLNGDFEEGTVGWAKSARGAAAMEFTIDTNEAVSGDQSAYFEVKNVGGGGMHDLTLDCMTPIKVKANKTYTVDFWVKAKEERTIAIDFLMNHDPWTNVFRVENIPVTTEWQVQFHTFEAPFKDDNMIFLFSFSRASNQNPLVPMWIDHVRFYEGEYEEETLEEMQPRAVSPRGKLAETWGHIKGK